MHENVGGMVKVYLYAPYGQKLTVLDANQNLIAGETYLGGRYLGSETPSGFVYAYQDALGNVRARSNGETDTNWPYGEFPNFQNGTSPVHFTGKPYDSEDNLDDFGARYYAPTLGRFLTPDWSASPEAVPYASLSNPQSLNLYSYVLNNPATATDPDGHWCIFGKLGTTCTSPGKAPPEEGGPAAPAIALLTTTIKGNTTTFQSYAPATGYRELRIRSLVKVDHRAKPGAGGPFESYVVGVSNRHAGRRAYGPAGAFIQLGDPRYRDIHGGGSSLGRLGSQDPYQPLTPTMGCTRACNADVEQLGRTIAAFQRLNPTVVIPYMRVPW